MIPTHDPQTNLALLAAMAEQLERHLEGDDLSRRVVVTTPDRRFGATMTLGVLCHVMAALERQMPQLTGAQRERLQQLVEHIELVRCRRPEAYAGKLRRELKSLLDSWSWFLDDCRRGEASCREHYAEEVWIRTRIHELVEHAGQLGIDVADEQARLRELDRELKAMLQAGEYIGPAEEAPAYPPQVYWWLYGQPLRQEVG